MTTYIFHGGGVSPESGNNSAFYISLTKNIPEGGTLLLVYFAKRMNDYARNITYITEICHKHYPTKNITIKVATQENFITEVLDADAIFFSGGSTEKLLNALEEYPHLKQAFENKNKTIAGSPAGAYALASLYSCHYEDRAATGLEIVPVRVATHYQSKTMPPRDGSVEMLKNSRTDLELIILKEGEWKVVEI